MIYSPEFNLLPWTIYALSSYLFVCFIINEYHLYFIVTLCTIMIYIIMLQDLEAICTFLFLIALLEKEE